MGAIRSYQRLDSLSLGIHEFYTYGISCSCIDREFRIFHESDWTDEAVVIAGFSNREVNEFGDIVAGLSDECGPSFVRRYCKGIFTLWGVSGGSAVEGPDGVDQLGFVIGLGVGKPRDEIIRPDVR